MASETLFLRPIAPTANPNPNDAYAGGNALCFNSSHSASGSWTEAKTQVLVKGGVAAAIAEAGANFINDPAFAELFTESSGVGEGGAFQGKSKSETEIVANFSVGAGETFSVHLLADLLLEAKEIENPNAEYSKANSTIAFLVLETSNVNKPRVLDYFGIKGSLISSKGIGWLKHGSSDHVTYHLPYSDVNVDRDDGPDYVEGAISGKYVRGPFSRDTQLTLVKINTSQVKLSGDNLIDRLGDDVTYGTIWNDALEGGKRADKIYASLGHDNIDAKGGNDIVEGGQGNDRIKGGAGHDKLHGGAGHDKLHGGAGDDKLHGGEGDDLLVGGQGSDRLTGGEGCDRFVFQKLHSKLYRKPDVITDFEVGVDKLEFRGWDWSKIDAKDWFSRGISNGHITNTKDGTLFSLNSGQELLIEGVNLTDMSAYDFQISLNTNTIFAKD